MGRFARPDTRTITISDNDSITVKRRLNAGERRQLRNMRALPSIAEGAEAVVYLVDWSLTDGGVVDKLNGSKQVLSAFDVAGRLDSLTPETFDEIHEAISKHVAEMEAEREAEKNSKDGGLNAPATLPSPSVAAGASSGLGS